MTGAGTSRVAGAVAVLVAVLVGSGCATAAPEQDRPYRFVYSTPTQIIAVKDSSPGDVLYSGKLAASSSLAVSGSKLVVTRSANNTLVLVDITTGTSREIRCEGCAVNTLVMGPGGAVYWLSPDSQIMRLPLDDRNAEPHQVRQAELPAPVPDGDRVISNSQDAQLVSATKDGYLVSRHDYQSLTEVGNPNILYAVDPAGHVTRLGPVAANTTATSYLTTPSDVLYAGYAQASSACGRAVLGSVSLKAATSSTIALPSASCSQIAAMWRDSGTTLINMARWNWNGAYHDEGSVMLEISDNGKVTVSNQPTAVATATNGDWTARINPGAKPCGTLQIAHTSSGPADIDNVCAVTAV